MEKIIKVIINKNLITSIIVIIIGIIIYSLISQIIKKANNKIIKNEEVNRKKQTYFKLFNNILKYIILLIVVAIVLQINGVNITSIIAGLGVVSLIAGLALQDALKDIIMGFNLIVDEYFSVGDVIKIDNIEGKILQLGLKTTKIEDINNGNIYVTANRNINKATRLSNQVYLEIPLSYELKIEKAEKVILDIIEKIKQHKNVKTAEYVGIQEFASSSINYKLKLIIKPEVKKQTIRDVNRLIKQELDKNKIEIPYTQIDIHNK